jgi:hypothetical protein
MVMPGTYRSGTIGLPQLISSNKLISIPHNCKVTVKVINYDVSEYPINNYFADNKLIPYQPSSSKSENIADQKFIINTKAYSKNNYYSTKLATVKVLGNMRNKRIAKLTIKALIGISFKRRDILFLLITWDTKERNPEISETADRLLRRLVKLINEQNPELMNQILQDFKKEKFTIGITEIKTILNPEEK